MRMELREEEEEQNGPLEGGVTETETEKIRKLHLTGAQSPSIEEEEIRKRNIKEDDARSRQIFDPIKKIFDDQKKCINKVSEIADIK